MVVETAIGISVAWLLERLTDKAKKADEKRALKASIMSSIDSAYKTFSDTKPQLANEIFEENFLKEYLCPEINKLLSRNLDPDINKIIDALGVQAVVVSEGNLTEEVEWLFSILFEELKKHDNLQELIDHRLIEQGSQKLDKILEKQDILKDDLERGFEQLANIQREESKKTHDLSSRMLHKEIENLRNDLGPLLGRVNETLPTNSASERMDTFLNKQLDRVKEHLNTNNYRAAYEVLKSHEEEIPSSEPYTQFRWHTNIAAYYLGMGDYLKAAAEFFSAYGYAPDEEKANANKIRAYLLQGDLTAGLEFSTSKLSEFPLSEQIWALHLNALKLNDKPTEDIVLPESVKQSIPVLHILSEIKLEREEYAEGFNLALKALKLDPDSPDLKRALLRAALTWASVDNVKAHFSQFGQDVSEALKLAFLAFDDPIQYLKNTQSPAHFVESATNLFAAASLVGEHEVAKSIIDYSFDNSPDRAELLLLKVKQLKNDNEIASIQKITNNKLDSLQTDLLFILLECSANSGDREWFEQIHSVLSERQLNQTQRNELLGLRISYLWNADSKEEAVQCIKDHSTELDQYIPLKTLYIRILDESGDSNSRDQLLDSLEYSDGLSSLDVLQIADVLYDFKRYYDASIFYQALVETPNDNDLSKRYISSLIRSDQRVKAQQVIEQLPEDLRSISDFRRLKANLAQVCGDLGTLSEALEQELHEYPHDSGVAVWYLATLFRMNEIQGLENYLRSDRTYSPLVADNEFEIAKYEIELGFEEKALERMYRVINSNPKDPRIAGFYLLTLLLLKNTNLVDEPKQVTPGSRVVFESNHVQHSVVVQPTEFNIQGENGWTECITENSEIAKRIVGLKVGDFVDLGPGKHHASVEQITSIYTFASEKAQDVISKSVSNYGPLWSINMLSPEGELTTSEMVESLKSRKAHVEYVFGVYQSQKLPLDILAKALGTDLLTLILEWPYKQYDLFVCTGRTEERQKIISILSNSDKKFVLDLSSLIELHRLNVLDSFPQITGKPLISLSLRDTIKNILRLNETQPPKAYACEQDGQILLEEVPDSLLRERKAFIESLIRFMDEECHVVSVIGPETPSPSQARIGEVVSNIAQDAIYLALEHDAILVCEDGALRGLAEEVGVEVTTWIQPLLMMLRNDGTITKNEYSSLALDKLLRSHNFTTIDAGDLMWSAEKNLRSLVPETVQAINTFQSPQIDLSSVIKVGANFLYLAAGKVSLETLKSYYVTIENALIKGRENYSRLIRDQLRMPILAAIQDGTIKSAQKTYQTFGDHLSPLPFSPRPTILSASIQHALYS